MAIGTYAELITALIGYLDRSDLTTYLPIFVTAADSRICDDVKIRAMEKALSLTLTAGDSDVTYPVDCIRLKSALYIVDDDVRYQLTQESEEYLLGRYTNTASTNTGQPVCFYLGGEKLYFNIIADQDYALQGTYYARLGLSSTSTTNWLLTNYPMIYVYGALIEAETFVAGDPRRWEAMYEEQLARVRRGSVRERFAASTRKVKQQAMV